jgi:hypothetical protein
MGGAYKGKDVVVDIEVDNTLVDNLYFADGSPVKYMPGHYYDLSATQLKYNGTHMGGVEVSLHDAFFADPAAIKNTYVIPVKMTNIVKGADQILAGTPAVEGQTPLKTDASQWKVLPKDYTLYAVKYINKWDGSWLRRGEDKITDVASGNVKTENRHKQYVENDEVMFLATESLNSVKFPMTINVEKVVPPPTQYSLCMINSVAGEAYGQQAVYKFKTPLKAGKTYVLTLVSKATVEGSAPIYLADADGNQTYSSVLFCWYVNPDFWQFQYNEKLIASLYFNLELEKYQGYVTTQIWHSEGDGIRVNKRYPFGTKNLCRGMDFMLLQY